MVRFRVGPAGGLGGPVWGPVGIRLGQVDPLAGTVQQAAPLLVMLVSGMVAVWAVDFLRYQYGGWFGGGRYRQVGQIGRYAQLDGVGLRLVQYGGGGWYGRVGTVGFATLAGMGVERFCHRLIWYGVGRGLGYGL